LLPNIANDAPLGSGNTSPGHLDTPKGVCPCDSMQIDFTGQIHNLDDLHSELGIP
jgi:hypothetical protein